MNLDGMKKKGMRTLGSVVIPEKYFQRFGTDNPSIDGMFGEGGFIKGQVITLSAARGAGKTTMLLQTLQGVTSSHPNKKCLYLSGEEYVEQLAFMAKRINTPDVFADNITDVDEIAMLTKDYDMIVIDSIAALTSKGLKSRNAIESYAMNKLYSAAKDNDCVIIFILHYTKSGMAKGDSSIEHTADTCIKIHNVNSEEYGELNCKCFSVEKNRFGQTKDSIFRMTKHGWDFTDPIKEDVVSQKKSKSEDPRKVKKSEEQKMILDLISKSNMFYIDNLVKLVNEDMDFDRLSRRLNDLVKSGKVVKRGRGHNAKYKVK